MIIENTAGTVVTFNSEDPKLGSYMSSFTGGISLLGNGGHMTYRRIYDTELWIQVCVNKLARGIARVPVKAYLRDDENNRERLLATKDELAARLEEPYPGGTSFDMVEQYTNEYLVNGSGLVALLEPAPGVPVTAEGGMMVPLDWQYVTAWFVGGTLAYYTWYRDGYLEDPIKLLPHQVIDFGFYRRRSPLSALALTIQMENAAKRQTISWFEGGGKMSTVITTSAGAKAMRREQVIQQEQELKDQHSGPDKAFRLALLTSMPDARIQTLEHDAEALQMADTRRMNREEAAALYDIPPPLIGILDKATFNNIDTQTRNLAVHTFTPHTTMQQQRMGARLIRPYPKHAGKFIEFDYATLLEAAPAEQADVDMKALQSGTTPNEIRRRQNKKPIDDPWADAAYVPANLIPIGAPGPLRGAGTKALAMLAAVNDENVDNDELARMLRDLVGGENSQNGNGNRAAKE